MYLFSLPIPQFIFSSTHSLLLVPRQAVHSLQKMATRAKLIVGTRPGERPFKLKLEPPDRVHLPWIKDSTFSTTINLSNPTSEIQLYKIKCTDNNVFRVQPPMGFLDAAGKVEVKVYQYAKTRPEENKHFLMFLHHPVTAADKNSKKDLAKIWKGDAAADGVTRMQAFFEEAKGAAKTATGAAKNTKTAASMEEKKSIMGTVTAATPAGAKADDKKKEATGTPNAKKKAVTTPTRKKGSTANTKGGDKTTNTAEEKTTL